MIVEHNLLPKQKQRKKGLKVSVDLFPLAEELYFELDRHGIIGRLKNTKQLGFRKVNKSLEKSRYDYVILQLYLHQLIKKEVQAQLEYSYNNTIKTDDLEYLDFSGNHITIGDLIQIFVIVYNIGHFQNTFIASQAILFLCEYEESYRNRLIEGISDNRYRNNFDLLINSHNYMRFHLINSFLILERCDSSKLSIKIAKELIRVYLDGNCLNGKMEFFFSLFRSVRNFAIVAYDLQVADIPFTIDLWNKNGIKCFLGDYLGLFRENEPSNKLVYAFSKLLGEYLYHNPRSVISDTIAAKRMADNILKGNEDGDYSKLLWNEKSVLNSKIKVIVDFDSVYLQLSFKPEERKKAERLFMNIDKQQLTRIGCCLKPSGEITLISAIRKSGGNKKRVAFQMLKKVVSCLQELHYDKASDNYILVCKFFLYYLFGEKYVVIKPVTQESNCVICTKGKRARIQALEELLVCGSEDDCHEVEAIVNFLENDEKNDTTITIPGSTVVYNDKGESIAEFDGVIIYPFRKELQIVLIEAKNTKRQQSFGKKCLTKKLKKLCMEICDNNFEVKGHDASYSISL